MINPQIFREYDIRGVVARDLGGDVPLLIGRSFASELRDRLGDGTLTLVVGRDNRPSSPTLAAGVMAGIREAGVDVIEVGTVPTPVLYYATERLAADGGLQITGSHNPPEYNGFKMLVRGRALYGSAIQALHRRIASRRFVTGAGGIESRDVLQTYVEDLGGRFRLARPVKLVADCGNGTASLAAARLLRRIGVDVVPLYCESDGTFPNHHPDPVVDENLADLIEKVKAVRADFGVAFDGDADRIGAVDGEGAIIRGDILLLLMGLDALDRLGAPQPLVFDVKCSQAVPEVFRARGGEPIMWKTGHSLIKEKMKETGAPIAGELSGHICFGEDYYGFDDALFAACRLAELVARSSRSLAELVGEFPRYVSTPEIRVEVSEEEKFDIVRRAVAHFRRDHDVIDVDGARVNFTDGWGLLRASNTQPVLVLRYEARTAEQLARIRQEMEAWLASQGVGASPRPAPH
jgi:phosphomannomutase/phosphoglucomutase